MKAHLHLLRMVKVAYAHATYICHGTYVDYFNTSFLANPWQYKYGICTNNAYRMENENCCCHGNQLMAATLM